MSLESLKRVRLLAVPGVSIVNNRTVRASVLLMTVKTSHRVGKTGTLSTEMIWLCKLPSKLLAQALSEIYSGSLWFWIQVSLVCHHRKIDGRYETTL